MISTIDLNKGYYQVRVAEQDIQKTAFVCRDGHFEFTRMPFGLKNASAFFQKLTSMFMAPCRQFAVPYIDDIVFFSNNWEGHLGHVETVLSVLKGAGLTVSPKKYKWGGRIVEFLGHFVGNSRRSIPARRVEAIRDYKRPRTKKQLRTFLGVISFHQTYMEMLADETAVLTPSTTKAAPNVVAWTREMDQAFVNICGKVSMCGELVIPVPEDVMSLITNSWEGYGSRPAGAERRRVKDSRLLLASDERSGEAQFRKQAGSTGSCGGCQAL